MAEAKKRTTKVSLTQEELQNLINGATTAAVTAALQAVQPQQSTQLSQPRKGDVRDSDRTQQNMNLGTSMNKRLGNRSATANNFFQKIASDKTKFRPVKIDMIYRDYFGPALTVTLNGSTIKVPVDGKLHMVHEDYWRIIEEKKNFTSKRIAQNSRYNQLLGADTAGDFARAK